MFREYGVWVFFFLNNLPSDLNCGEKGDHLKNNLFKCKGLQLSNSMKISVMGKSQLLIQTVSWVWVQKAHKCEENECMSK